MKEKQTVNKRRFFLLLTFLFLTTYITSKTFKKVNYQDISILGSELFSIDDLVANSSLNFTTPLIFVKTIFIEKELKKNLSLENVSVFRQVFPFGLKILIKTRTPIAYSERILKGKKITGFVDKEGFFLIERYSDQEITKKLSSKVFGWKENYREALSKILNFQIDNDVIFITISYSPNGFLTLEEKSLKTILLGFNPKIIENQLQLIKEMKDQIKKNIILEKNKELGKIKYDDKILHRSKVIKYFVDQNPDKERANKDFLGVYKKISKNKKYFFSIKDVILLETLSSDGFEMPKEFDKNKLSKNLTVPGNINALIEKDEIGMLMLKLIEIIGTDDLQSLDPETLYFIVNLLNKAEIKKVRNKILNLTLPLRV